MLIGPLDIEPEFRNENSLKLEMTRRENEGSIEEELGTDLNKP